MSLDSNVPKGPIADKWTNHKNKINLVKVFPSPENTK